MHDELPDPFMLDDEGEPCYPVSLGDKAIAAICAIGGLIVWWLLW